MDNTKRAIADEATEKEIPRAAYEGVLTIDVDAQVESMEEQEDARWHQLLNAHRTRKVLTGQLGGIEKLESGWMVAVTYYNGFRIIIPMNEMMINLSGDGRENADTLNRQVRIANNMEYTDLLFLRYVNHAEKAVQKVADKWLEKSLWEISQKKIYIGCVREEMKEMQKGLLFSRTKNKEEMNLWVSTVI